MKSAICFDIQDFNTFVSKDEDQRQRIEIFVA